MVGKPTDALELFAEVCDALETSLPSQDQIGDVQTDLTVALHCSIAEGSQSDGEASIQFFVGRQWQPKQPFLFSVDQGETYKQTFVGVAAATRLRLSTSSVDAIGYWRITANGEDILHHPNGTAEATSAYWLGEGLSSSATFQLPATDAAELADLGDICKDGRACKHGACYADAEDGKPSTCKCHDGWTGTTCESNVDDCQKDSCSYDSHGFCIDGVNDFTCNCNPGWSGKNCEVKGCNVVDAVGFNHSALNTRFEEDTAKLQNGKSTFVSADGEKYIYWCSKSNFYLIGSLSDWEENANGDCIGLAYTTPSRTDFRTKGVAWKEWNGAEWEKKSAPVVVCGSSCPIVDVNGFNNPTINGRYTEETAREQNGRPTFWDTDGDVYIYWCKRTSVYVIGFKGSWNENEAGSCLGAATTLPGASTDVRSAEWQELDADAGFSPQTNVTVVCAIGNVESPARTHLPSTKPLPAPSVDMCDDASTVEACAKSHDLLINEYNAQQFFAVTSCISAKNLRDGESFDGGNAAVSGDFSWKDLESNMKEKLVLLESMDDQISRIEELVAKNAALANAGAVDLDVQELQNKLKALVGDSVAHIEDEVTKQTREMEELAKKNSIQLKQAAALQRKALADALRKQDGVAELESEVDAISEDIDLLLHSMATLEERIDYLHKYGESNKGSDMPYWNLFDGTTEEISITQRALLVQVKRQSDTWEGLTGGTQTILNGVLANTTRVSELSSDERTALNAAMLFESEAVAAFTLLDPESSELTASQRRILTDIRQTFDATEEDLNSAEQLAQLDGLLNGTVTPKSLSKDEWNGWNDAMAAQRTLTGFSMIWDEDGDGFVSSSEKVALLMDMVWPASTGEGKVLALFRSAEADVEAPTARELLVKHFGEKAGTVFDNSRRQRSRRKKTRDDVIDACLDSIVVITQSKAEEVAKDAHGEDEGEKLSAVVSPGVDLVKAVAGKPSWADAAIPVAEIAAEVFVDEKYAPLAKEAVKHTKRFVEMGARTAVAPVAAVGGFLADTACDVTKNEYVCDMNSCINVGFDVGTSAAKGAVFGGAVGAAAGAGLGLVKAAFSGDLKGCANGLIKIGGKVVKLAEKYFPKATSVVKETFTAIKQTPVYKTVKRVAVSTVSTVKKTLYFGVTNYVLPTVNFFKDTAVSGYRAAERGVQSGYRAVKSGYRAVKSGVQSGYRAVKSGFQSGYRAAERGVQSFSRAASSAGRSLASAGRTVIKYGKKAISSLCFWCRRRRWRRAVPASEFNASDVDPLLELLGDAELMASATQTLFDNSDGLFFNVSKGVPIDVGPLVHPDIEAKYRQTPQRGEQRTAAVFTESLAAYQAFAQKRVELDSRIETSRTMTENVAQYLLDDEHDLRDQADLALQLLRSRREETVFRVLEQASEMNKAYQYTSLEPGLELHLPDSPSLGNLQQLFQNFSESYALVSEPPGMEEWKENEGTVYYTFNGSTSPDAIRELNQTGSAYFTLQLAEKSQYRDVRLIEPISAYMFPMEASQLNGTTATINISKGRFSTFHTKESGVEPVTFLHTYNSAATIFQYDATTCMPFAELPCTVPTCSTAMFRGTSPSGEWKVTVPENMREAFVPAVNLRLAFKVRWVESTVVDDNTESNAAMFENDPCDQPTCFLLPSKWVVSQSECTAGGGEVVGTATDANGSNAGMFALAICLSLIIIGLAVFLIVRFRSKKAKEVLTVERSHHTVVNEVYDTSAVASSAVAGQRCPQCHAKLQFCACDVRRNTLSQPARRRAPTASLLTPPTTTTTRGLRAHTMDGRKKTPQLHLDLQVGGHTNGSVEGICAYVSKISGSKCTRECVAGALYCANFHLCPTLNCGKSKSKAKLKCADCDGGVICTYVSQPSGRTCSKLRAPGALYCANFHLCPTPECGGVKPKASSNCTKCEQLHQQQSNAANFIVQRSASEQHAFLVPMEQDSNDVGDPAYDLADASQGSSAVYSQGSGSAQDSSAVYYSQASGSAQPNYDYATQDSSAVYYSQATGSAQPNYDYATQDNSAVYYSQASGSAQTNYDYATQDEGSNVNYSLAASTNVDNQDAEA